MQNIIIEIPILLLFIEIFTKSFIKKTNLLLKHFEMLDQENKLNNDNKIKLIEFFDLLEKEDKVNMSIIFVNSEKIVQQYIISLYFHLFLAISDDQVQYIFKYFTKCIDDKNRIVLLTAIVSNHKIYKYLHSNNDITKLQTSFLIINNSLHINLP